MTPFLHHAEGRQQFQYVYVRSHLRLLRRRVVVVHLIPDGLVRFVVEGTHLPVITVDGSESLTGGTTVS